jgi:hypothetical protein
LAANGFGTGALSQNMRAEEGGKPLVKKKSALSKLEFSINLKPSKK